MKLCNILHNTQYRFHGTRLTNLQLLDAEDGRLEALFGRETFPNLVWLRWKRCPYSSLSSQISMKNLRVLQVELGQLKSLWQGKLQAPLQLRVLEISSPLSKIPKSIGQLKHLERIVISEGRQVIFPEEFCDLQSLKELTIKNCKELKCLPASLGDLKNLKELNLQCCPKLKCLPSSIRLLTQLTELHVYCCPLTELPFEMVGDREALAGSSNNFDSSIEQWMPGLQDLVLDITNISKLSFSSCVCSNLQYLHVARCDDLVEIGTLPNTLVVLELKGCPLVRKMKGLFGLTSLQWLYIEGCGKVEELPIIETLISLQYLHVRRCVKLKIIRGLGLLTKLREIRVSWCSELEELPGIEDLSSSVDLDVYGCPELQWKGGAVEQLCQ